MVNTARSRSGSASPARSSGCQCEGECWCPTEPFPTARRKFSKRPAWLGPTRVVEWRRCPRCRASVWQGWDADIMAGFAVTDANSFLTAEGEARAILRGRVTWQFITVPRRRLHPRDPWSVTGKPAGQPSRFSTRPTLVVVQHVCGRPIPTWALYDPPEQLDYQMPEDPPF